MSGGVDSSVTAALLAEARLRRRRHHPAALRSRRGAPDARARAAPARTCATPRASRERLGIPHYVLDYEKPLPRRGDRALSPTPMCAARRRCPCVACNETVKFRDLLGVARDLGAAALATGHYARRVDGAGRARAASRRRCSAATRAISSIAPRARSSTSCAFRWAISARTRPARSRARFDLPVAEKPDSQDICFVPSGDYAALVEKLRPERGGARRHRRPRRHACSAAIDGIIHFTVGQRKGLGLAGAEPLYRAAARARDAARRGRAARGAGRAAACALARRQLAGRARRPTRDCACDVKLRSAQPPVRGDARSRRRRRRGDARRARVRRGARPGLRLL